MKQSVTTFKIISFLSNIQLINMKKYLLVLALFMTGATVCFSTPRDSTNTEVLEIPVLTDFHYIHIEGNVTVIFVGNQYKSITLHGKNKNISKIKVQMKNDRLYVVANKLFSDQKVTLYVPVSQVNNISVDGDALVFSETVLNAKTITLSLRGNTTVSLNTTAQLIIDENPDYDINYSSLDSLAEAKRDQDL